MAEKWATTVFKPYIQNALGGAKFLLFQDSLGAQKTEQYARAVKSMNGECVFGPTNLTEVWQPIDCGHIGATVKAIAMGFFEGWLDNENLVAGQKNWQSWFDNKVSAKDTFQLKFPE